jgi:hypothetical protein
MQFIIEMKSKLQIVCNTFEPVTLTQSFASAIPPAVIANVASLSGKSGLQ